MTYGQRVVTAFARSTPWFVEHNIYQTGTMLWHWTSLRLILCPTATGLHDICRFVWVVPNGSASINDMVLGMQGTRWELQYDTVQYSW